MTAGAPRTLRPLRWGAGLVRGRFELHRNGHHYVVDAGYLDLDERIHLYRDGLHVGSARRKASFVIDDDVRIEAAVSKLGMKYVRARSRGAREPQPLAPARGTGAEHEVQPPPRRLTVSWPRSLDVAPAA